MSIKLRKHNEETYGKIQEGFKRSKKVAVIHPTGTGKSFLALKLLEDNRDKKAIYIAPSNAILHTVKKNIFESEMDMLDFPNLKRITYQKLMKLSDEEIEKLGADIVILDEFHHCGAPEWGEGVDRFLEKNPDAQVLGLSATPIRYFDYSRDMAEELFGDNIASEMSLEDAINSGILPRARYVSALYEFDEELRRMQEDIDKIRDSEKKKQAQAMLNSLSKQVDENTGNLPEMLSEQMKAKNGKYIVFCKSIEDMQEKIKQAQRMFGKVNPNITTYSVSSKLHDNERALKGFEKDDDEDTLKLMFAVDMLNEGYHINDLDGVIMMRPTYSPTIYAQQLGRALTVKSEDGKEPLVIDLVNNLDSIKIIEDLYEKLRQYESTVESQKEREQQSGLIIHDKIKEFRDVAKKISELSKRKSFSLQEKIEFFERYVEEGNGDIDGQTIYEGKPIGQWATQIRYGVKNGHEGVNPTEDQLERLWELGILERKIDSTIDEKIDALIEWNKKYPDVIVERKKINQQISDATIKKLKEIAQAEGIEFSELEERYKKIISYNEYVRSREINGKLTESQWNKCKEGNLRGKFGFPTKIEQLAEKLKIDVKQVADIIDRFGSMDNFIQMYRDGRLSDEQTMLYNSSLINNIIDIDCNPLAENYAKLLEHIFGYEFCKEQEFRVFSSKWIEEQLETIDPREKGVIQLRFGLIDGKIQTLSDTGKYYGICDSRAAQVEEKALRKLRHPSRARKLMPCAIQDLKGNVYVSDEERVALADLERDILNSNLIYRHESVEDLDFGEDKFDIIRNIIEQIPIRKEQAEQEAINEELKDIPENIRGKTIEDMGLSTRSYNVLSHAGIHTIAELSALSIEEFMKIRNMGKKTADEIISRLAEYGIKLAETLETQTESEEMADEKNCGIVDMGLSARAITCLTSAGINTLADLENLSYKDLLKLRALGKKTALEIVAKAKEYGITLKDSPNLEQPDSVGTTAERKPAKKVYSASEIEEIKARRTELEEELGKLEEKTKKARELLAEYNELIGDDKVKPYDETPDFKDE